MTKARREAQDQLRAELQATAKKHLTDQNNMLIRAREEGTTPQHIIDRESIILDGMIRAYKRIGLRTDVFKFTDDN